MVEEHLLEAQVLLSDPCSERLEALANMISVAGFQNLVCTTASQEVPEICLWRHPHVVVIDLSVDVQSTLNCLLEVRRSDHHLRTSVIVVTEGASGEVRRAALSAGARDFLERPLEPGEVALRVRNQAETQVLYRELHRHNEDLEERVRARTADLKLANLEILERLAHAAEYRDDDTGEHARRVGDLSAQIADELSLEPTEVELIWRSAMLHDVGKIGISDLILLKPGKLTVEEMTTMRTHTTIGASILSGGRSPDVQMAERIAQTHHEWWDGSGYHGMQGDDIPIEGRIVAIADVFDALTHERPYKEPWPLDQAMAHIAELRGRQFDPRVHDAFVSVMERARPALLCEPAVPA